MALTEEEASYIAYYYAIKKWSRLLEEWKYDETVLLTAHHKEQESHIAFDAAREHAIELCDILDNPSGEMVEKILADLGYTYREL